MSQEEQFASEYKRGSWRRPESGTHKPVDYRKFPEEIKALCYQDPVAHSAFEFAIAERISYSEMLELMVLEMSRRHKQLESHVINQAK